MLYDGGLALMFKAKWQTDAICRIASDEDLQSDLDLQKSQIWPNYDMPRVIYEVLVGSFPIIDRPRNVDWYIADISKFIQMFGPSLGFKHEAKLTG